MGVIRHFSSSKFDRPINRNSDDTPTQTLRGNPNPSNYTVEGRREIGNILILQLRYPDAVNYEGRKILVFENVTFEQLQKQKEIDPHFSNNRKYHSPIARFEPTIRGWMRASKFAEMIQAKDTSS